MSNLIINSAAKGAGEEADQALAVHAVSVRRRRPSRPSVLMLTHRVPFPPNRGDRIRSLHILKHLAARADVSLACLADEPVEPATRQALQPLCHRLAIAPLGRRRWLSAATHVATGKTATEGLFRNRTLGRQIRQWAQEAPFDAALVFCSSMAQYVRHSGVAAQQIVLDLVDVDSEKFRSYAQAARGPKRWLYTLESRRLRRLEARLASESKAVTLVSESEAELFRRLCPNDRTYAAPNGVDLAYFAEEGRRSITSRISRVLRGSASTCGRVFAGRWAIWC